jgi:hypothetical protein
LNAAHTEDRTAVETPRKKDETNSAARNRQIRKAPRISTVDPLGYRSTRRALARHTAGTHRNERAIQVIDGVIRDKAPWNQRRGANRLHGIDSFLKPRPEGAATSSKLSQSQRAD